MGALALALFQKLVRLPPPIHVLCCGRNVRGPNWMMRSVRLRHAAAGHQDQSAAGAAAAGRQGERSDVKLGQGRRSLKTEMTSEYLMPHPVPLHLCHCRGLSAPTECDLAAPFTELVVLGLRDDGACWPDLISGGHGAGYSTASSW
ncbi:hypothetical protein PR202_gb27917 [Eleusine coracana subsp. coracana]|uniref:Uncharacterized protein n=1 Tax=Eleusine coracana subsp. coracana TaxID=191504 RepID=A0AAV5FVJ2_ELECO|nr:hypothetical protein PR202_gb27917 [Eleusine coracana subsp. coracana]